MGSEPVEVMRVLIHSGSGGKRPTMVGVPVDFKPQPYDESLDDVIRSLYMDGEVALNSVECLASGDPFKCHGRLESVEDKTIVRIFHRLSFFSF